MHGRMGHHGAYKVVSILVLCLVWLLGYTSAQAQSWEKIIDDGDPGYSETGNAWATWTHPSGYQGDYRYLSHHGKNLPRVGTATWQVVVPHTGQYEISVYFRATVNRTSDADFNVYDGANKRHHTSLNQSKLPTGWHKLGVFSYTKGQTSRVVLDGTDDNQSDEADAVRWKFVSAQPPPPPPPPPTQGCEDSQPGTYTMLRYATDVQVKGDWKSGDLAKGAPDQKEATSPNVDQGDELLASQFQFCTPKGSYTITRVRVGLLGRMQYATGQYQLIMFLESVGKRFTFSQTQRLWAWGDVTAARSKWTLQDLQALTIRTGLGQHPGGKRDSDAWVDAFGVEVQYTIAAPQCPKGFVRCGDSCVDAQKSNYHCGACDRKCGATSTCVAGQCTQQCPAGLSLCQQTCINYQTDSDHCGGCEKSCQEEETCVQGQCKKQCPADETLCGSQCTRLSEDKANCGGCGKACPVGKVCALSKCVNPQSCPPGQLSCLGHCVDVQSNPTRCGGCDIVCGQGVVCRGGQCLPPTTESNDTEPGGPGAELPGPDTSTSTEFPSDGGGSGVDAGTRDLSSVTRTRGGCFCDGQTPHPENWLLFLWVVLVLRHRRSTSP